MEKGSARTIMHKTLTAGQWATPGKAPPKRKMELIDDLRHLSMRKVVLRPILNDFDRLGITNIYT